MPTSQYPSAIVLPFVPLRRDLWLPWIVTCALAIFGPSQGTVRRGDQPEIAPSLGLTEPFRVNLEQNLRWMLARERKAAAAKGNRIAGEPPRVGVFAAAGVWHLGARSI